MKRDDWNRCSSRRASLLGLLSLSLACSPEANSHGRGETDDGAPSTAATAPGSGGAGDGDESGETGDSVGSSGDPDTPPDDPAEVSCDDAGPPRTIDCFYDAILESDAQTVAEALALLPDDLRSNMFFMAGSESRHMATMDNPRVILYGDDASFLVSMSTLPDDPLYEVFELMELRPDGNFKLRQLEMNTDPPRLGRNDTACQVCHSPRVRPLWGQYRTWIGEMDFELQKLFGEDQTQEQKEELAARLPERFGPLILPEYGVFPGWSSEVWNFQFARLMNVHLTQMMRTSDAYTQHMRYRLAASLCGDTAYSINRGALMTELGIEPEDSRADLRFDQFPGDADHDYYTGGGMVSEELVEVAVVDLVFGDGDARLGEILQPIADFLAPMYSLDAERYAAHDGYLPFDIPEQFNGGSGFLVFPNGEEVYSGYGGNYQGYRLVGYQGFWAHNSIYRARGADPSLLDGGSVREAFCEHVSSKI